MTKIIIVDYPDDQDWIRMRNNALSTQRRQSNKVPSSKLKLMFLASEHSPIYTLHWTADILDVPYWVSNQLVRSHEGFIPFVSSQRNDIQKDYDRRQAPQNSPVNIRFEANAMGIITISRKRLCLTASNETRKIWEMFLEELKNVSPELYQVCVKPCVYRNGICPELFSKCRFNQSDKFTQELKEYQSLFKLP